MQEKKTLKIESPYNHFFKNENIEVNDNVAYLLYLLNQQIVVESYMAKYCLRQNELLKNILVNNVVEYSYYIGPSITVVTDIEINFMAINYTISARKIILEGTVKKFCGLETSENISFSITVNEDSQSYIRLYPMNWVKKTHSDPIKKMSEYMGYTEEIPQWNFETSSERNIGIFKILDTRLPININNNYWKIFPMVIMKHKKGPDVWITRGIAYNTMTNIRRDIEIYTHFDTSWMILSERDQ